MEPMNLLIWEWAQAHHWLLVEYKQPKVKYDPFEIFQPNKTFLREKIKELKQNAYTLIHHIREAKNHNNRLIEAFFDFPPYERNSSDEFKHNQLFKEALWAAWEEHYKQRHEKICRRIRDYEWRLKGLSEQNARSITEADKERAKNETIQNYYIGKLVRRGKEFVGLCPFHEDSRPSFTIYQEGRRFKCFPCGVEGDVIDFVQKTQNLTFIEAVKYLLK